MFKCHTTKYVTYNTLPTWRKKKSGACVILCGKTKQWWCRKIFDLLFTWQFNTSFMLKEFTPPLKARNTVFENITSWKLAPVTPPFKHQFSLAKSEWRLILRYVWTVRTRIHACFVTCLQYTTLPRSQEPNRKLSSCALMILSTEMWFSMVGCQSSVGTNVCASSHQHSHLSALFESVDQESIEPNRDVLNGLTMICIKNWELAFIAKPELLRDSTTFLIWDFWPAWLGCENKIGTMPVTQATNIRNWKLRETVRFFDSHYLLTKTQLQC